ncbi:MAG: GNAT family N-acetyltransferase [Planctomycetota bacterium]
MTVSTSKDVTSVDVVGWNEMTEVQISQWRELRTSRPEFAPPFFAPDFAAAVHAARQDVWIAILRDHVDQVVGFFPFHRRSVGFGRTVGVPVGRFLNDAHYVVADSSTQIDWRLMARQCNVVGFDLHAAIGASSDVIESHRLDCVQAYQADFDGDSEAYFQSLRKRHRTIEKQAQKTRKLGREIGPIRLEVDCRSPEVLQQTIDWKRAQYRRTHILDLFTPDWTRRLIQYLHRDAEREATIRSLHNEPLRGLLSILWAGDRVAAAHFGMIEQGRLHYWFPTYDPELGRYSPGTALFVELICAATANGIDTIDMGYGEQPYKRKQTATTSLVACGTITDSSAHRLIYQCRSSWAALLKKMPLKEPAKAAWRSIHPNAGLGKIN